MKANDYGFLILVLAILILGIMAAFYLGEGNLISPDNGNDEGVVCTADAKMCPDGSYVGRVGPNCEFRECPGEIINTEETETALAIVSGTVLAGPQCPVVKDGEECPPRGIEENFVVYELPSELEVLQFRSDSDGKFFVEFGEGEYLIKHLPRDGAPFPRCGDTEFSVASDTQDVSLQINCDTGIR